MNRKSKILVLLEQSQDYKLLTTLLEKDYEIVNPATFPDATLHYDLIIVDGISHSRYKNSLADEKTRANPLFLPVLILTGKKDVDIAASFLWKTVDELIVLPVNKTELHARVEMLLRTRKQSIELDYSHNRLIKQNQEQLNLAVKSANVGLWDWNLETNKVYYSPEWKNQIGFEDNEISNETSEWSSRVHPDDLERCQATIAKYIKNPWPDYTLEFRFRHKNGTYIWIYTQASLIYNDEGKPVRMLGSHVDITEQKRSEDKLKLYTRAIEQSPVSLNITDSNGDIVYVNSGFTVLSGYTPEEAIGKNPRILKSGVHSNEFYKELWETLIAGKNWSGELCNKNKAGNLYWVQATISPVLDSKGRIMHYVAVKEDISERKKFIEDLKIAKEHAEESDKLKSAFLANMSHEIRTPLNGILGFTELLVDPECDPCQKESMGKIIIENGDMLLTIINDVLDISKIEAGQIVLHHSLFEVHKLMDEIKNSFAQKARNNGLELRIVPCPSLSKMQLNSDFMRLKQVLTNLVSNAIKYTEKGYIEIGCYEKPNEISFYVKDSGIGISEQAKERIFERFNRHDAFTKKVGGTGLGLAIAKSFVEMLGGKIWVESEIGKGSTFYFSLPI